MKGLKSYITLLDHYSQEVRNLEVEYNEVAPHSGGIPYRVINSRMPTPKLYLLGPKRDQYYYHDVKERLMPPIIDFLSEFEVMTDNEKVD